MLFPHLAGLRDLARISVSMALQDEQRGDGEQGFVIRRAVRRLGGLMRYGSATAIGNLVGIAIATMSYMKPAGIIPPGWDRMTSDQKQPAKAATYVAYLNRIGHPEEASAFSAEQEAGITVKAVSHSISKGFMKPYIEFAELWAADYALIWNAVTVILFGVIALLIGRIPPTQTGARLLTNVAALALAGGVVYWMASGSVRQTLEALTTIGSGDSGDQATALPLITLVASIAAW